MTTDQATKLAARIEREGLTPELCEAAALAFGWRHHPQRSMYDWIKASPAGPSWRRDQPPYATSLDAVRAEMLPGWRVVKITTEAAEGWRVVMSRTKPFGFEQGVSATMEAAWLAAILRAVAAQISTKEST
jgi:hypothetical protein